MYVDKSTEYLTDEGGRQARILPFGSVLVSCIGKLGKCAIASTTLATNQQINSLIPTHEIDSAYLYFVCKTLVPDMEAVASVTIVPIVNKTTFSALRIPLPPVEGQKRIAAILTEQMAVVERARAAAEAQLEAAKALPAAYLRAVFSSPEAQAVADMSSWESCARFSLGKCSRRQARLAFVLAHTSATRTFSGGNLTLLTSLKWTSQKSRIGNSPLDRTTCLCAKVVNLDVRRFGRARFHHVYIKRRFTVSGQSIAP